LTPAPFAVGYSRQSKTRASDLAAGRIVSSSLQLDQARAYALARGWQFDDELSASAIEQDTSGGTSKRDKLAGLSSWKKRPGLQRLLDAAAAGRFQHLIVFKLSRLARSAREGLEICDAFERCGVGIHSTSEGIDFSSAAGRLLRTMMLAVAEMELEGIREWAVESSLARAKEGKHHGPMPAWIERDPDGQYQLKPAETEALRRLVELRLTGISYAQVARQLNAEGVPGLKGGRWSAETAGFFLTPEYRLRLGGHAIYGRGLGDDDPRRIVTPEVFPPVLDERTLAELEATQRALESEGPKTGNRRAASTTYLLTGIAWCGICGARLNSASTTNARFYGCRSAATVPGAHPAIEDAPKRSTKTRAYVSADSLEEAVTRAIGYVIATYPESTPQKLDRKLVKLDKPRRSGRTLAELDAAEERLLDLVEAGALTTAGFIERQAPLIAERMAILEREESERRKIDAGLGWQALRAEVASPESYRLALHRVIERIEAPVTFPGVVTCANAGDARWVRLIFARPLPSGRSSVLAAIHHVRFTGPRIVWEGDEPPVVVPYRAGVKRPGSKPRCR
jgi:site-specific DNA recombinase